MSPNTQAHEGSCHCGAVQTLLRLSKAPAETRVRACQCGFCRPRGTRTIADPQGLAMIRLTSPASLNRYRFGLRSADYLLCATCGTYVAAVQDEGDRLLSVVNVGGLDIEAFRDMAGEPVSYDGERIEQRKARRRVYWMPLVIEIADRSPSGN